MSEWISVNTRLPTHGQLCLVYIPNCKHYDLKNYTVAEYNSKAAKGWEWDMFSIGYNEYDAELVQDKVTHWMELTTPNPKEQGDE